MSRPPTGDYCVTVSVTSPAESEVVCDLLWQEGATAVEERAAGVVGGFPEPGRARAAAAALGRRWPTEVRQIDRSWSQVWRRWARPVTVGRFHVRPAWLPPPPPGTVPPEAVDVVIEPGNAFGIGSHPSTMLCLEAVEARVRPGDLVLDVGCGTGVLSVAAALLGARVVGLDIDAEAMAVAVANAARNGVSAACAFLVGPPESLHGRFDLVVANLGGALLPCRLAPALSALGRGGGRLVVAGLLEDQEVEVASCFTGRRVAGVRRRDGWSALELG